MPETVDVPKIGRVKKIYVWAAIGGVALFVGWRYYQAAKTPADTAAPVTGDVGAAIDPSGVVGSPVSGNVQYAGTTTQTDTSVIATNEQWTARAVELLGAAGMDPAKVYQALGDYLARRPLDSQEQQIVSAAIAAAGQPPVGGPYSIVPQVGPVTLTAPSGLKATKVDKTTVTLTFSPVTGAAIYYLYRKGVTANISGSRNTTIVASGLTPGKAYSFAVAAAAGTGKVGPKSSYVTVTTKK